MKVLRRIKGKIIDAKHPDYGRDQNIGLYDIVSPASMKQIEKNSQITVWGKTISGRVDYGYCQLCPYASQNHHTFVCGALAAIRQWVRAVHPAMDCMGESIEEQSH